MIQTKYLLLLLWFSSNVILFESCVVNTQQEEKVAFENYTGKWRLKFSYNSSDSLLINSAWISLQSDSNFYSSSSIFWRNDSLRLQSLQGRWFTFYYYVGRQDPGQNGPGILLKVDLNSKEWLVSGGGTKNSSMVWTEQYTLNVLYRWELY